MKKLMIAMILGVLFSPVALASQTGQIDKLSEYDGRALQCSRASRGVSYDVQSSSSTRKNDSGSRSAGRAS